MRLNIKSLCTLLLLLALPPMAAAGGASDALNYISQGSTSLKTANRNVFVGGSFRMFVPQSTTQFVSITPPSFSAGCGGIDAAFGGISFIDGDQLKQMVKGIMQASPGYALDLAIRTLCPMCSDVMQVMRDLSNWANSLALDSCGAAQAMVNTVADSAKLDEWGQIDGKFYKDMCKKAEQGNADWYESIACEAPGFTSSLGKTVAKWTTGVNSGKSWQDLTADDKNQLEAAVATSNKTYAGLLELGLQDPDAINLMMSVMGTSFAGKNGEGTIANGWRNSEAIINNPQLMARIDSGNSEGPDTADAIAIEMLLWVLLAGTDGTIDPTIASSDMGPLLESIKEKISASSAGIKELPYYWCSDVTGAVNNTKPSNYLRCVGDNFKETTLGSAKAQANNYIQKKGYLIYVAEELTDAASRISQGDALTSSQLALINAAPLPVYRMLKVAAIYPSAGQALMENYSKMIALMLIRSHFLGSIKPKQMGSTQWDAVKGYRDQVNEFIQQMAASVDVKTIGAVDNEMSIINALYGALHTADRLIAEKSVISGAAGSSLFSRSVMPSGHSGGGAP